MILKFTRRPGIFVIMMQVHQMKFSNVRPPAEVGTSLWSVKRQQHSDYKVWMNNGDEH